MATAKKKKPSAFKSSRTPEESAGKKLGATAGTVVGAEFGPAGSKIGEEVGKKVGEKVGKKVGAKWRAKKRAKKSTKSSAVSKLPTEPLDNTKGSPTQMMSGMSKSMPSPDLAVDHAPSPPSEDMADKSPEKPQPDSSQKKKKPPKKDESSHPSFAAAMEAMSNSTVERAERGGKHFNEHVLPQIKEIFSGKGDKSMSQKGKEFMGFGKMPDTPAPGVEDAITPLKPE